MTTKSNFSCNQKPINWDNQSSIVFEKKSRNRPKYISLKYYLIRNEMQKRKAHLKFITSEENVVDKFTKPIK